MMIGRVMIASACLCAMTVTQASAQDSGSGLAEFSGTAGNTNVKADEYYTAVAVNLSDYQIPADGNRKELGKALLNALGLKKTTKSITVAITFASAGGELVTTLPEQPLLTYTFDDKRNVSVDVTPVIASPLWRLSANETITATLNYRYSEGSAYDIGKAATAVSTVIPSSAVVSTVTSSFFSAVTNFASGLLSAADRQAIGSKTTVPLSPYGDSAAYRRATFNLRIPGRQKLGTVNIRLLATPTLLRTAKAIENVGLNDLKFDRDSESIAGLTLMTAPGTSTNVLGELTSTSAFQSLSGRTDAAITTYCADAVRKLDSSYKLTRFDRTLLIYEAMRQAGFQPNNNAWFFRCFPTLADQKFLSAATGISGTPTIVELPIDATKWDEDPKSAALLKNAMGCWMTQQTGTYCARAAPTPRETLLAAMAPNIALGALDLPGLDLVSLPDRNTASPDTVLNLLKGKATAFKCFLPGLILIDNGQHAFNMLVEVHDKKITAIQIRAVSPDMLDCIS